MPASPSAPPEARRVKILIADEDPISRVLVRRLLESQRRLEVVGEAHDADSTLALLDRASPHVLMLDYGLCLKLPDHATTKRGGSFLRIITLAAPEKQKIIESFRLGARGVMLKDSPPGMWRRGIATILSGQYWLGNESLAVLIEVIRESLPGVVENPGPQHFGLTPREIEIVQKIADGRSNKEVGEDCSIRERTVKHHLTNIFGKVGVSSRLELALFARDHKLLATTSANSPPDAVETESLRAEPQERRAQSTNPRLGLD